ncbi:MAG TPA: hypothetical protein VFP80_19535 [Thermoanaerobaculia bacterium]|nr:hypothetical protein [Thermoanaerobaculia bacterium]
MRFRLALLFFASLTFASMAGAACLVCVGSGLGNDGTCQPSLGICQGWCCLVDEGTPCSTGERIWGCSEGGWVVPTAYFASPLPLRTEGSALRLRLGPAVKPTPRRCEGAAFAMAQAQRS